MRSSREKVGSKRGGAGKQKAIILPLRQSVGPPELQLCWEMKATQVPVLTAPAGAEMLPTSDTQLFKPCQSQALPCANTDFTNTPVLLHN